MSRAHFYRTDVSPLGDRVQIGFWLIPKARLRDSQGISPVCALSANFAFVLLTIVEGGNATVNSRSQGAYPSVRPPPSMQVRLQLWVELARSLGDRGLQPQPQPPDAIRWKARLARRPRKAVSTRPGCSACVGRDTAPCRTRGRPPGPMPGLSRQHAAKRSTARGISRGALSPSVRIRRLTRSRLAQRQPRLSGRGLPRRQDGPRALLARGAGCRGAVRQPERGGLAGPAARAVIAPRMAKNA